MMNLSELRRGDHARVLSVNFGDALGTRLAALGIFSGATLTLLKVSPLKHTYLIAALGNRVALSREIAKEVRVWPM